MPWHEFHRRSRSGRRPILYMVSEAAYPDTYAEEAYCPWCGGRVAAADQGPSLNCARFYCWGPAKGDWFSRPCPMRHRLLPYTYSHC